jgi:hypothetical protein
MRLFLCSIAALALASTAAAAAPVAVVTGRHDENHATTGWNRAGTVQYVAFTRRDLTTDRRDAYLRTIGRYGSVRTVRISRSADSDVGGFFYGTRLLYGELHRGSYDLRIYDIPSGRTTIPTGVNTSRHEWLPTRSGRYLLFNRDDRDGPTSRVVLRDLTARTEVVLGRSAPGDAWVYAGQVRANWAVWTECNVTCDVYKRDIAAETTTVLPKPSVPDLSQYDASVTPDGTVYAARHAGEGACDSPVELVRFGDTDPPEGTVIARLVSGRFTTLTYARVNPAGTTDLFFARGSCESFTHDVFKLRAPG